MRPRFSILLLLLVIVSAGVGWFVPAYYDWTGSDQSRPSPLLLPTAAGVVLLGLLAAAALPWLPLTEERSAGERPVRSQFNLRTMLAITGGVGLLLAALRYLPRELVSSGVLGVTCCWTCWNAYCDRTLRGPVAAMLACMYLPYLWSVTEDLWRSGFPEILLAAGFPALFHALLLGGLFHLHLEHRVWVPLLLTAALLILGRWVLLLGPKPTLAYLLFLLIGSLFGSFCLNALVRI